MARTLEEDILSIFYASWQPLSIEDVWERLSNQGVCIPILYLAKVIRILTESGCLKQTSKLRGVAYYQANSFWDRFKPRLMVSVMRGAVKVRQATKMQHFKGLVLLAVLYTLIAPAYSETESQEMDLSPVELIEQPVELASHHPQHQDQGTTDETSAHHPTPLPTIPTISTSRPSFTDAVTTVPQGSLQAENGATYTDNRGDTYSWTTPETLLRLGLIDNTEFRFTVPNYIYVGDRQPGNLINNFGDISVGFSHHLALPGRIDLAVIPILNIPTGANKASSNSLDPQLRVTMLKTITSQWSAGGHLDTRWNTGRQASADVVFNPTFINYYYFTKKLCGFLEYSGFVPTTGKTTQFIQSGSLYTVTPRQQVDARIAVGLNKSSPNLLVGFGYSIRLDGLFGKSRDYATFKPMRRIRP